MKTGFGETSGAYEQSQQDALMGILLPVLERSMILAAEYSKACGRDTVLSEDMEYAIKYCVMYTVGQDIGSLFPEIYNEESSDEEEQIFAKSQIVRRPKYKKIVEKEELLPE